MSDYNVADDEETEVNTFCKELAIKLIRTYVANVNEGYFSNFDSYVLPTMEKSITYSVELKYIQDQSPPINSTNYLKTYLDVYSIEKDHFLQYNSIF